MAAQKGKSMLVKIGDGAATEVFTSLAGIRTRTFAINRETVDVTNSDSADAWRELLADAGIRSISVSGSGVFTDATVDETLRAKIVEGTTTSNFQLIVPGFGTFEGPFELSQIEYAGEHNGEATYSFSLESAGAIAWTAA